MHQFPLAVGEGFHRPEERAEAFFPDEFLVGRFLAWKVVGQILGRAQFPDPVDAEVPHQQGSVGARVPDEVQRVADLPEFHVQVLDGVQGVGPVLQDIEGDPVEALLQWNPDGMEPGFGHFSAWLMSSPTRSARIFPWTLMRASPARMMTSSRMSLTLDRP